MTNAPTPADATAAPGDGSTQHRRRRRRRRGRGGRGGLGPSGAPMPDRHIFEVTAEGAAQPTGATAPPEPSRAIATRGQASPPAVEAPPPSLSAPAEKPKLTKPARRRKPARGVAAELKERRARLRFPHQMKNQRDAREKRRPSPRPNRNPWLLRNQSDRAPHRRQMAKSKNRRLNAAPPQKNRPGSSERSSSGGYSDGDRLTERRSRMRKARGSR